MQHIKHLELLGMKMIIYLHINLLHGICQHPKEVLMMIQPELLDLHQLISITNGIAIVLLELRLDQEKVNFK